MEIDTAIFRYPFRIRVDNDRVLIMDLHNKDYYYHLFNFPDLQYISSFGKRGQAPEEILSAENFRFDGNQIHCLDANKREIKTFSFCEDRNSVTEKKSLTLEEAILRPLDLVQYNDSIYIVPDYSGENRFCWVNTEGKILHRRGYIPTQNHNAITKFKPALAQAWRSFIDYNPRNNILVAVTQLGEVLEIYNLNDSTHTVIMGLAGEPEFQVNDNYAVPSGIMGFSDIMVTDKFIYVVFHGRTFKELTQQKKHIDGGQFIYVFDLNGNPVRNIFLTGLFMVLISMKLPISFGQQMLIMMSLL